MIQAKLTLLPSSGNIRPASLLLTMPPAAQEARTPTHLITLVDVSESMADNNKLRNVKHCLSLLLRIMSPDDRLSVITFGDAAHVIAQNVATDSAHVAGLTSVIDTIRVDGCTNLSAGILAVNTLMEQLPTADRQRKTLLLILTDGHANRGVTSSDQLLQMLRRIQETNPSLSMNSIAYGTDHNADLLRVLAEQSQGAYSIVQSLDDAAITIGDAFGAAMSCTVQGLTVHLPPNCSVKGPYTIQNDTLRLGDGYAGVETLLLLSLPADASPNTVIRVTGTAVPSLEAIETGLTSVVESAQPDAVYELTEIRYQVAEHFRTIKDWSIQTPPSVRDALLNTVESIRSTLSAERFQGNPLVDMLRMELDSLKTAIERLTRYGNDSGLQAQVTQHMAFTSMARGTTRPISPSRLRWGGARQQFGAVPAGLAAASAASYESDTEDPQVTQVRPGAPPPAGGLAAAASVMSPSSSAHQQRTARLLHTLSQGSS